MHVLVHSVLQTSYCIINSASGCYYHALSLAVPLVQFTTTHITVQERKDKTVFAPFNISRTGADLNSITTVILEAQAPAPDNATAGLDFFAGPMNEIVFDEREKIKTGMVGIRPDNIQEGKEVFHIHIKDNNNGRRGSPAVLEVVILDAFEGK